MGGRYVVAASEAGAINVDGSVYEWGEISGVKVSREVSQACPSALQGYSSCPSAFRPPSASQQQADFKPDSQTGLSNEPPCPNRPILPPFHFSSLILFRPMTTTETFQPISWEFGGER